MNALAMLREWLECNTAGESISFHLIAELENYIVSCHGHFFKLHLPQQPGEEEAEASGT